MLTALVLGASSSLAQTPEADSPRVENIRVEYATAEGCPGFDTFFAWVRERAPSARLAGNNEPVRLFSVSFEKRPGMSVGRLTVHEPSKTTEMREVTAATCEETAAALALIVAVAVDPSSMSRAIAPEQTAEPEPQQPEPQPVAPPTPPAPGEMQADTGPVEPVREPGAVAPWRWLLAVSVEGTGGPAPDLTPALRLAAATRLFSDIAPTLRLSVARGVERAVATADEREAVLTWTAGRVEGCVAFPTATVELEPCVGFEGGVLHGEGTRGVEPAKSESRPWWAALAGARIRLLPARYLAFELGGGSLLPLQRDAFTLQPNTRVHKPPPVAGFVGFGAGVWLK